MGWMMTHAQFLPRSRFVAWASSIQDCSTNWRLGRMYLFNTARSLSVPRKDKNICTLQNAEHVIYMWAYRAQFVIRLLPAIKFRRLTYFWVYSIGQHIVSQFKLNRQYFQILPYRNKSKIALAKRRAHAFHANKTVFFLYKDSCASFRAKVSLQRIRLIFFE